jgi:hypothetical protein
MSEHPSDSPPHHRGLSQVCDSREEIPEVEVYPELLEHFITARYGSSSSQIHDCHWPLRPVPPSHSTTLITERRGMCAKYRSTRPVRRPTHGYNHNETERGGHGGTQAFRIWALCLIYILTVSTWISFVLSLEQCLL